VTTAVNDEDLADFNAFQGCIAAELMRMVIDVENAQIIAGDGTGENLLGLLAQTGILTRAIGADTALDAVEKAFTDLRVGAAYVAPNLLVIHPSTFSSLRRTKDTTGRYLTTADPTAAEASSLGGHRCCRQRRSPRAPRWR
jgi:HK97 family phage major capsid protein